MKKSATVSVLAFSIATVVARAATFTTVASGDWSSPAAWNVGVGFPNTYAGDSAVITTGRVIDYTGGMTTPASPVPPNATGGLAVANGNTITINGGTLTQTTLTTEMRIGEGTGATNGNGTLTIRNAGLFDSGASIGVAVGVSLPGAAPFGNGTVNLEDGIFRMGAGATTGGLGVGLDGSTGIFNVGDGNGSADTALLDLATNNIQMGIGAKFLPPATGGAGLVTVSADGRINQGTATIFVGQGGGNGHLTIIGGTLDSTGGGLRVGEDAGSLGVLDLAGGTISGAGELRVGSTGGTGTFTMTNGMVNVTNEFNVGRGAGAHGTATIGGGNFGVGSTFIGRDGGTGGLTVAGGAATVTGNLGLGSGGGAGTLTLSNAGTFNVSGATDIGDVGTGTLNIGDSAAFSSALHIDVGTGGGVGHVVQTGGAVVFNEWIAIGLGGGANGSSWDISGGAINSAAGLEIGSDRQGAMTVSGTANIQVGGASIGVRNNSNGTLSMSAGTLAVSGGLDVGGSQSAGTGTFNLSGGTVTAGQIRVGTAAGNGTLNFTGGSLTNGAAYIASRGDDSGGGQTGVVNVLGATWTTNGWVDVGRNAGSNGTVNITGAGSVWNARSHADFNIGVNGGNGTVNVTGGGRVNSNWWVDIGRGSGAVGKLVLDGAGTVFNHTNVGLGAGENALRFILGEGGDGTVEVKNGAVLNHLSGDEMSIGINGGGTGTMLIDGGIVNLVSTGPNHFVGQDGGATGTLTIVNGGQYNSLVSNADPNLRGGVRQYLGSAADATGTLNIASGVASFLSFTPGNAGTGTVNQTGGTISVGQWTEIGQERNFGPSVGTYNMLGGTFNTQSLGVGSRRDGEMNLAGGTVNVGTDGVAAFNGWGSGLFVGLYGTPDGGSHGSGTLTQTGGTINVANSVHLGNQAGSTGLYDLSGGTLNVNADGTNHNIEVGENGTGTMTITGGAINGLNYFNVGGNVGSHGTLNINLTNPAGLVESRELYTGWGSGTIGVININSGTLRTNEWTEIGRGQPGNGGSGTININGPTAVWEHGTGPAGLVKEIEVGYNGGTGNLNITGGGTLNHNWWINIGRNASSTGHVTVDGAGSKINIFPGTVGGHGGDNNAQISIGEDGVGTMDVTNGGAFNHMIGAGGGEIHVGRNVGSNGTLSVSTGSTFTTNAREIRVAPNGTGTLNITDGSTFTFSSRREADGARVDGNFLVGENNGANGTVNISNSTFNMNAWGFDAGWNVGATATINLINSTVNLNNDTGNSGHLFIGRGGTAVVNQLGGVVTANQWSAVGMEAGGSGTYNLSGGGVLNTNYDEQFYIGRLSTGLVVVDGAGSTLNHNPNNGNLQLSYIAVGREPGGNGTLRVQNGGTVNTSQEIRVGADGGATGTLEVFGGIVNANAVISIGRGGTNVGTLNMTGGTVNYNQWITVGHEGGHGALNISGGTISGAGDFDVAVDGVGGVGVVTQTGGTVTTTAPLFVGRNDDTNGSYTISGGVLNPQNSIRIAQGNAAVGVFTVSGGTVTTNGDLLIGNDAGTNGTLNLSGGTITAGGETYIGVNGGATGTFNASGGTLNFGTLRFGQGAGPTSTTTISGTANITGSLAANRGWVNFGEANYGGQTTVNQTGGTLAFNAWFEVGIGAGTSDPTATVYAITGGLLTSAVSEDPLSPDFNNYRGAIAAGSDHGGTIEVGGTAIVHVGAVNVGLWGNRGGGTPGNGVFNMSGGSVFTNEVNVGFNANNGFQIAKGIYNQSGGTMKLNGAFYIARNLKSNGTANLNGGIIQTNFLARGTGTGALNFNGGALKANGDEPDFVRGFTAANSEVFAGGAVFDTNGHNVGLTATLNFDGVGGLTKNGNGTLTLNADSTYAGGSTINGGVLSVVADAKLGAATGAVRINNTATLLPTASFTTNRPFVFGPGGGGTIDTSGGNLTLGATSSASGTTLRKNGAGTLTVNGPQSYAALVARAGTTTLNTALGTGISTATANAVLNFTTAQKLAALNIGAGGVTTLTAHMGGAANVKPIVTTTLAITAGGKLDLTNNALIVRTSTLAAVNAQIATGYASGPNGYWDGAGINSSVAANDPAGLTAVGVLANAEYGYTDFAGITGLVGTEILVKYTWYGDTDLNGVVNGDDFSQFAAGFTGAAPAEWFNGDFDYNGTVNGDDFSLFAAGFSGQTGQLRPAEAAVVSAELAQLAAAISADSTAPVAARAVVPEPGSLALLAVGAFGLLRRHRS